MIHAYAPTSTSEDKEVEQFYVDMFRAIKMEKTKYTIITGDFNAKLGKKFKTIHKTRLDERNNRGDILHYLFANENLFCLNIFFQKPGQMRWTWKSPDGVTKNEIDYIQGRVRNKQNTHC